MDRFLKRKADVADRPVQAKALKCVVRKYDAEYIKFGFIRAGTETVRPVFPMSCVSLPPVPIFGLFPVLI